MKRSLPAILVALVLAAAGVAWVQYSGASSLRQQVAESTAAREAALKSAQAAEAELARLKAEADLAKENITRLTAERDAALSRAKSAPVAGIPPEMAVPPKASPDSGGKDMMEGFAKMFSTEEGKKMMRAQMSMAMKMQYGSLAKDLKLDPKVADQVLGLLADRQSAISEVAFGAMKNGKLDETTSKEMAEKSTALKKEYDGKLKAVLGDGGMAQMNDYERTLGDRMMLAMHEQQFAASGSALEQSQRDGLLQVMKEERMKTPPSAFDMNNQGDPAKQMSAMRDDAAVEAWLKQEEAYQQRVLQNSTQVLTPDQVNALRDSFKQQLDMQRFGIKMSKEMFKGSGSGAAVIVAPTK